MRGRNTYIVYAEKLVIEKKAVFTDPLLLLLGKRKICYGQICVRKLLVFPNTFSKKSPHVPFNYLQNNPSFPAKNEKNAKKAGKSCPEIIRTICVP